jgi:hypothetical protein
MADNVAILPSVDVLAKNIATDDVGGIHYQRIKVEWGADGVANEVDDVYGKWLPTQASRRAATASLTVVSGANVSSAAVDCRGMDLVGIEVPNTFDGTTIAFQVSTDNVTFQDLYDLTNTRVLITVTASRSYPVWGETAGWSYVKLVTGSPQTGDTVFKLQLRS